MSHVRTPLLTARPALRAWTVPAVAVLVGLPAMACGTRVRTDTATRAVSGAALGSMGSQLSTPITGAAPAVATATPTGSVAAPLTQPQGVSRSRVAAPFAGTNDAPGGRPVVGGTGSAAASGSGHDQPAATSRSSTSPATAPGAPIPSAGTRSTVLLASIGTYSGPAGTVIKPVLQGAQLWVNSINARGGLNGHPVKLFVYDDSGDPARYRAQAQQAIERDHVLAFLADGGALTASGSSDYITAQQVPVIGTEGGQQWAYESPMYFPQMSTGDAFMSTFAPSIADQLLPKGLKRLGSIICVEGAVCDATERIVERTAKTSGLERVYRGRSSLAQPDFTAECLAARNASAEVLLIILDQNSAGRISSSCTRQGYKPTYALIGQGLADNQKKDPNLSGAVASTVVFPYFQSGTAATDEFQQVRLSFGRDLTLGPGLAVGWTAGKLLERAGRSLPEPPSRAALLEGLWGISGDDLGGLTYPLSFTRGKPADPKSCWFNLAIRDSQWTSPDGAKLHCSN